MRPNEAKTRHHRVQGHVRDNEDKAGVWGCTWLTNDGDRAAAGEVGGGAPAVADLVARSAAGAVGAWTPHAMGQWTSRGKSQLVVRKHTRVACRALQIEARTKRHIILKPCASHVHPIPTVNILSK